MAQRQRGHRKVRQGVVIGDKMQKTVVVETRTKIMHPLYKKYIRRRNRFMAHDEHGCRVGDRVEIVETRPLSKTKRWRVRQILERSPEA